MKSPCGESMKTTRLEQAKVCARHAEYFALMADGHLGYGVPIGGVIAAEGRISPTAVGFDIACGNKAVRLDIPGTEVRKNIHKIWMTSGRPSPSALGGRTVSATTIRPLSPTCTKAGTLKRLGPLRHKANAQLGTIGSGNHYVDIFVDEQDSVWWVFTSAAVGWVMALRPGS